MKVNVTAGLKKLGVLFLKAVFAEAKSPKAVAIERALIRAAVVYIATKAGIQYG